MAFVPAIPAPKSDQELKVFYYRKWVDSKDIIETKNEHIERLVNQVGKADNQVTEGNKAIKYLL